MQTGYLNILEHLCERLWNLGLPFPSALSHGATMLG